MRMKMHLAKYSCALMISIAITLTCPVNVAFPATIAPQTPLVVLAAKKVGIRQCLPAIAKIAEIFTAGVTEQDIVINWDRDAPNSSPFFSLTGMGAGISRAVLSITAIPNKKENCALLVERVSTTLEACTTFATNELPFFPGGKLIDGITVYRNPKQPTELITLVQNSNSCTMILRQSTFEWPPNP